MAKAQPEHRDKLGRLLNLGDCVVYPQSNSMLIGTIQKINPKMIKVTNVPKGWPGESLKYPQDLIKIDGPEVTMYLIKNAK